MKNKDITFGREAREKMVTGVNTLANCVSATLGPKGRNAMIELSTGPLITKDGITVAKHVHIEDHLENMGAQLALQTAQRTNDMAGDGTTTATNLAQAMVNIGMQHLNADVDAQAIRRGMEKTLEKAVGLLADVSVPVTDLEHVASISANDPVIGKMIADLMKELGEDGVITIEKSLSTETSAEAVDGVHYETGYQSPYLMTDVANMEAVYEDIPVLLTDEVLKVNDLARIVTMLVEQKGTKKLLIIGRQMENGVLQVMALNKQKGVFDCLAVRPPKFGRVRKEYLEDLARMTGATVVGSDGSCAIADMGLDHLGLVQKVVARERSTTIVGIADSQKVVVAERIEELKGQIKVARSENDRELLRERISKLSGGIGIIYVGANTEADQKEKHDRVEDAVNATRAAKEEGIVAGGGVALLKLSKALGDKLDGDEDYGRQIIVEAMRAPAERILVNAGASEDVMKEVLEKGKHFNAKTNEFVDDMIKAGIVDPAKVERCALENAVSIATMVLTTEVGIVEEVKEETCQSK